jgi:hypothetical protein
MLFQIGREGQGTRGLKELRINFETVRVDWKGVSVVLLPVTVAGHPALHCIIRPRCAVRITFYDVASDRTSSLGTK